MNPFRFSFSCYKMFRNLVIVDYNYYKYNTENYCKITKTSYIVYNVFLTCDINNWRSSDQIFWHFSDLPKTNEFSMFQIPKLYGGWVICIQKRNFGQSDFSFLHSKHTTDWCCSLYLVFDWIVVDFKNSLDWLLTLWLV